MKKPPFQIIEKVPEEISKLYQNPSYQGRLVELFNEMEFGQVAVIKKSEWIIPTPPAKLWSGLRVMEGIKDTFASRTLEDCWYLKKVKFPIRRRRSK